MSKRDFYIPDGAVEIADKQSTAIVYTYTDSKERPCARGFSGRKQKPEFMFYFLNEEKRAAHISEYFEAVRLREELKREAQRERAAFKHDYNKGDVLYCSWGYDQRNIDFYEVVEIVSPKTIKVREIGCTVDHSERGADYVIPAIGQYLDDALTKRVSRGGYIRINSFSSARRWDKSPVYQTASGWGH